ncbi:MAG: hypothetical protein RMZ42_33930 [Nostoc sp. DedQUE05]|nr:hypothetical protein [Nostoc sp. DedQUE05]MDZ8096905.1 hypothetical protein [Nostoc sp. DedQUE05]
MKFQEMQIAFVQHQSRYRPNGIANESEDELNQLIHRLGQYHLLLEVV